MPNNIFGRGHVMNASIDGLAEAQAEIQRLLGAVNPNKGMGATLDLAAGMLHRYATGIVHVDTGRLKNSLFVDGLGSNNLVRHVATNVEYGIYEERRGGSHAFFGRTVREEGPHVNDLFFQQIAGRR